MLFDGFKMRFLRRRSPPIPVDGPLMAVLEAEKTAAAAIAAAKREAEAWLEAQRRTIARERDAILQALAARAAADEEAARQAAGTGAAKMVAAADQFSRELRALSDRELGSIVARHLAAILPGPEP